MAMIHDKYVIELKEVIKGYGNDPQVKDPLKFPCDYKFYEIDGVAICEDSFNKMKQLEDVAIPKAEYETRLKADMVAMLTELKLEIEKYQNIHDSYCDHYIKGDVWEHHTREHYDSSSGKAIACDYCLKTIQQKIDKLKGECR